MKTAFAFDPAFRAAFFLTGRVDLAEGIVSDAITALVPGKMSPESLLVRTMESAIRRTGFPHETDLNRADLPEEIRRLAGLAPLARGCFVLRILFGISPVDCGLLLNLSPTEFETVLLAGLRRLAVTEPESFCSSIPLMVGNLL